MGRSRVQRLCLARKSRARSSLVMERRALRWSQDPLARPLLDRITIRVSCRYMYSSSYPACSRSLIHLHFLLRPALHVASFTAMASSHDEAAEHLLEADEPGPPSLNRFETDDETSGLTEREHSKARRLLYISHFLSTWNSRLFEFGAFLFLATIYPRTLLPASIYALARAASAAILSPYLGSYIDTGNRLRVVRLSIGKLTFKGPAKYTF